MHDTGRVSVTELTGKVFEMHDLLSRYINVHDEVFKPSWRRAIPIPGIFKAMDFARYFASLRLVEMDLERAVNAIPSIDNVENPQLASALKRFGNLLSDAVGCLREICGNLDTKSQGQHEYSQDQYKRDLARYEQLRVEYMQQGQLLNNLMRGV